jgi:hypothetical protein
VWVSAFNMTKSCIVPRSRVAVTGTLSSHEGVSERLVPIGSHLGARAHGTVGTGPCPAHCCVDDDPSRSMLYERTAHLLTLGTEIALA